MLKIKDNVDLKELEKFGFIKCEYGDRSLVYEHKEISEKTFQWILINDKREMDLGCEFYDTSLDILQDILFDLIQAGLVEKMEE